MHAIPKIVSGVTLSLLIPLGGLVASNGPEKTKKKDVIGDAFREVADLFGNPVTRIDLVDSGLVSDAWLVYIQKNYPDVQDLRLNYVAITDDGLKHLVALPKLKSLNLYAVNPRGNYLTDRGLENMRGFRTIEKFSIGYAEITNNG